MKHSWAAGKYLEFVVVVKLRYQIFVACVCYVLLRKLRIKDCSGKLPWDTFELWWRFFRHDNVFIKVLIHYLSSRYLVSIKINMIILSLLVDIIVDDVRGSPHHVVQLEGSPPEGQNITLRLLALAVVRLSPSPAQFNFNLVYNDGFEFWCLASTNKPKL